MKVDVKHDQTHLLYRCVDRSTLKPGDTFYFFADHSDKFLFEAITSSKDYVTDAEYFMPLTGRKLRSQLTVLAVRNSFSCDVMTVLDVNSMHGCVKIYDMYMHKHIFVWLLNSEGV